MNDPGDGPGDGLGDGDTVTVSAVGLLQSQISGFWFRREWVGLTPEGRAAPRAPQIEGRLPETPAP